MVAAARQALAAGDVALVLPYVPASDGEEVRRVLAAGLPVRALGEEAGNLADQLFFETVVRLHRAGEGAPTQVCGPPASDR